MQDAWFIRNLSELPWETVPGFGSWYSCWSANSAGHRAHHRRHRRRAILMFGAPDPKRKVEWIANPTAAKHGASVAKTTSRGTEVYGEAPEIARVPAPTPFGT